MATLSELRNLVRTQTETTAAELPNTTLDWYIRQAFDRTVAAENTWPSYEESWSLTLEGGSQTIAIPVNCNRASINSLVAVDSAEVSADYRLNMVDHETAEDYYSGLGAASSSTCPLEYSIWAGNFYFWPRPLEWEGGDGDGDEDPGGAPQPPARAFLLRGHRYPIDWIAIGDESVVDADPRLHYPLTHYAIALAYAQQEDETLEDVYMKRWQMDVEAARQAIMEPSRQQPMQFGGGRRAFRRIRHVNINTP